MDSNSEHSDSKLEKQPHNGSTVKETDVDVAALLAAGSNIKELDPEEAAKVRRKIDRHVMPLMCFMYLMTFADKNTLGQAAVLGIQQSAHLNTAQFNWLGSVFYLSYLFFEYPQNLALQRFPVGKWMSINIFVWSIALMAHSACKSFGALVTVRLILGMCEGAITPGFMIVTSMFYTREEQTKRVGYWFLMNGVALILLGFLSFGVLHTKTHNFLPWQWLMIIAGIVTLCASVVFWVFFPDSPTTARFLTPEERLIAVERIKANQTGVENKHWKRSQFIATVKDPRVWLLAFFAAFANMTNSLTVQRQLIVKQFGFNTLQTTLLGCVDGVVVIFAILAGVTLASYKPVGRAYAAVIMFIPALLGSLLVNTLPGNNRFGLLFSYWLCIFAIPPFPIALGWISALMAGHTRRTTANAILLILYGIGNTAGPQMWEKKYQPRNHLPWGIIAGSSVVCIILLLIIRSMFAAENKRRENSNETDSFDDYYLPHLQADGSTVEKKVDRNFLDLTDIENKEFRYVL